MEATRTALKKPVFTNQGPREWTPRVGAAVLKVEFLRSLIPPELLQEIDQPFPTYRTLDSLTGKQCALMLRVHARKWMKPSRGPGAPDQEVWLEDNVWITQDGTAIVEAGIRDLLGGKTKGYEHLAGKWAEWLSFVGDGQ